MEDGNPIVLRFGDSFLRRSDVEVLCGNHWISDQVISFFFEYLDRTYCQNLPIHCVFVGPEVAHLIKMSQPRDVPLLVEALQLHSADLVFLPVNDANDPEHSGGSHWSLLLYSRAANVVYHYDSYLGYNTKHAEWMTNNLRQTLACPNDPPLVEPGCPQQTNQCDCGIRVIYNAYVMLNRAALGRNDYPFDEWRARRLRADMLRWVHRVARTGESAQLFFDSLLAF